MGRPVTAGFQLGRSLRRAPRSTLAGMSDRDPRDIRSTRPVDSRCCDLLRRAVLGARFSDAQRGFEARRADRAQVLLPQAKDPGCPVNSAVRRHQRRHQRRQHPCAVRPTLKEGSR
jgi:hypothetical protein